MKAGQTYQTNLSTMVYVYQGEMNLADANTSISAIVGTLVNAESLSLTAIIDSECVIISNNKP
ncbi:hypothetical protein [Pseudoalteromonas sp.]|uniref:hypothetical protein n=1 Tax=Pseudoalteromonas sp. TaxID=53249 RepID=UPI003567F1BE